MKKLYLMTFAILAGAAINAQVINPSFENWTTGEPDNWTNFNGIGNITDENGNTIIPATEETNGPTDGNSYIKLTSFNLANSTDPTNLPNGIRGSVAYQSFNSTDKFSNFEFDVKYDIKPNDTAVIYVQALNYNGTVGSGRTYLSGSQSTFMTVTLDMSYNYSLANVSSYNIYIVSSEGQLFSSVNSTIAPGSWLATDNITEGAILQDAPNATNIIATDIDDNGDGSDLEVSFDIPDETKVSNYYIIAASGFSLSQLGSATWFIKHNGIQIPTTGAAQTYNFTTAGEYWVVNSAGITEPTPIVENIEMTVYVLVEGANGYIDVYASSNPITLTSNVSVVEYSKEVSVYPNPTSDFVNFKIDGLENGNLIINSITGQEVINTTIANGKKKVNLSSLNNGVYIYTIHNQNGESIKTSKLVVRK